MKKTILVSLFLATSMGTLVHANQDAQAVASEAAVTQSDQQTVSSGTWTKKKFSARGSWTISTQNGVTTVSLDEDFKTKKAPDLKLFLSPLTAADVNSKNAVNSSVLISLLDSHKGAQSYVIPADVDLSQFKSILIHCEAYTKLWSAADL